MIRAVRCFVLTLLFAALPAYATIKNQPPASGGGGGGTVTNVSVATANGFAGTVAMGTTTPAITIKTTITGLLTGTGTAIGNAAAADVIALWSGTCSASTFLRGDGSCVTPTAGTGTVTSVALTAPSVFAVAGSPITSAGTLAVTFASGQTANQVLATPDQTTGALALLSLTSGYIPANLQNTGVTVVATTNQANTGTPTIDGFATTAAVSIVLDTAQSTASQNGPWIVQTGAWTRPAWYPSGGTTQVTGYSSVIVRQGSAYMGSTWKQTNASAITIDTTSTTWTILPYPGLVNRQTFTSSGTWTKPAGSPINTQVLMCGAGGPGGGGASVALGTAESGGGSGGGGAFINRTFPTSILGGTETVTIGTGGSGGNGGATGVSSGIGAVGTQGSATSFGTTPYITINPAGAGSGGQVGAGSGGGAGANLFNTAANASGASGGGANSGSGAGGSAAAGAGAADDFAGAGGGGGIVSAIGGAGSHGLGYGGPGGGAGGGLSTTTAFAGGASGALGTGITVPTGGAATGAKGGDGSSPVGYFGTGSAGGGGGGNAAGVGGAGGVGGMCAAGGGGGAGTGASGTNGGAGAAGGSGYVVVITTF